LFLLTEVGVVLRSFVPILTRSVGVVQDTVRSFQLNGESNLDLEYAMPFVDPTPVSLLQTGDLVEGSHLRAKNRGLNLNQRFIGAGFDNWLDAVDGSFCTFEGGDDPNFVNTNSYSSDFHIFTLHL